MLHPKSNCSTACPPEGQKALPVQVYSITNEMLLNLSIVGPTLRHTVWLRSTVIVGGEGLSPRGIAVDICVSRVPPLKRSLSSQSVSCAVVVVRSASAYTASVNTPRFIAVEVAASINEKHQLEVQTLGAVALHTTTACTDDASIVGVGPLNWAILVSCLVGSVHVRV